MDGFLRFSLSVQNRRTSRLDQSPEHHLEAIFRARRIEHVRSAATENGQRPGFLFPSVETHRVAPDTGHPCLAMLGAKSICEDGWRRGLAEAADRPARRYLHDCPTGHAKASMSHVKR